MPIFTSYPIGFEGGCLAVLQGGWADPRIRRDRVPVREAPPGWRCNAAYRIGDAAVVVDLDHRSEGKKAWWLDAELNLVGEDVSRLPEAFARRVAALYLPALDESWRTLLEGPVPGTLAPELFRLPPNLRQQFALLSGRFGAEPPRVVDLSDGEPAATLPPADRALLAPVTAILSEPFREFQARLLTGGAYEIACPITGLPLFAKKTLVLSDFEIAVPFASLTGECYFIFWLQRAMLPAAAFFPARNLLFVREAKVPAVIVEMLRTHVATRFDEAAAYLRLPPEAMQIVDMVRGAHLGHALFNDLAGIEETIRSATGNQIERLLVSDAPDGEMYGPLDELFPEFAGRVERVAVHEIPSLCYRNNWLAIRLSQHYVSNALAGRVIRRIGTTCRDDPIRREVAAARAAGARVVVLGLRVENRTWDRLAEGYAALVELLAQMPGRAVVLIDGHNRSGRDEAFLRSYLDRPDETVAAELGVVAGLETAGAAVGVRVVSMVGMTLDLNLALVGEADFFVAPWGAGLAKYKWIWNLPGIVFTNRACLATLDDLHLYDSPDVREDAIPCDFIGAGFIVDLADDALSIVRIEDEWRANFAMDEAELQRLFRLYLDRTAPRY